MDRIGEIRRGRPIGAFPAFAFWGLWNLGPGSCFTHILLTRFNPSGNLGKQCADIILVNMLSQLFCVFQKVFLDPLYTECCRRSCFGIARCCFKARS